MTIVELLLIILSLFQTQRLDNSYIIIELQSTVSQSEQNFRTLLPAKKKVDYLGPRSANMC